METIFRLKASELDMQFIEKINDIIVIAQCRHYK